MVFSTWVGRVVCAEAAAAETTRYTTIEAIAGSTADILPTVIPTPSCTVVDEEVKRGSSLDYEIL